MSSRNNILQQIKNNKPAELPLPNIPLFGEGDNFAAQFETILTSIGGRVVAVNGMSDIEFFIKNDFPDAQYIASNVIQGTVNIGLNTPTDELEKIDLAVLRGVFGVAENGCIWLPESAMMHRAVPIITQHLCLILNKKDIVPNMHHAYKRLETVGNYGIFLAGPSKTADIEQSLVIGAHGSRSMTVFLEQ